jgi:uncharacterized RDD family membrane protein YckC
VAYDARAHAEDEPAEPSADRVLAIDNVPLDLPVAGAGTRSLAAFIDYLFVTLLGIVLVTSAFVIGAWMTLSSLWWLAVPIFGLFVLEYGYFAGCEILMNGQTPGKRAVGLRVVSRHGSRAGRGALLVRNAVRNLDVLIGVPFMALDPLGRRLGDRLAGTLVVRTRPRTTGTLVERVPRGWTPRQIEVLESFLERSQELQPERAARLADSLVAAIERDDPGFLVSAEMRTPLERLRESVTSGPERR